MDSSLQRVYSQKLEAIKWKSNHERHGVNGPSDKSLR